MEPIRTLSGASSHFDWSLAQGMASNPGAAASTMARSLTVGGDGAAAAFLESGSANAMNLAGVAGARRTPAVEKPRARSPQPLRPRGGFGGYLHDLRVERGATIRQLAAAAGVHHTYISKLERGDRQAPEESVVEALAAALGATPSQLDQLRWRAGLVPHGESGPATPDAAPAAGAPTVPGDPTLTLVAEALSSASLPDAARDRLRQAVARAVEGVQSAVPAGASTAAAAPPGGVGRGSFAGAVGSAGAVGTALPPSLLPAPPPMAAPDPRATLLAGLMGGWQTLDEAAAELRVTAAYLWELVQGGHLRAWALPGATGSPAGVRVRREDLLALLQPVTPLGPPAR